MQIREPAVANQFYPGDPAMLKQDVLRYLASADFSEEILGRLEGKDVKALIVPHAGYIYSGSVAGCGFKLLKKLSRDVEWKVVLIGVSHMVPFIGVSVFPDGIWRTPLGEVAVRDVRAELGSSGEGGGSGAEAGAGGDGETGTGGGFVRGADEDLFLDIPEAHTDEHSLEVQVPFLQVCLDRFVLYPLAAGSVRPDFLASKLAEFVARDDVIVVVSSDLSHYLPYDEACEVDKETLDAVCGMKTEKVIERGDACGIKGILTAMFLAEKFGWKPVLLDYRNSGDTAGDRSRVVGYASVGFMGA